VSPSARFGVDPAELLAAARAAERVRDGLRAAREAMLAAGEPRSWADDAELALRARRAVAALVASAEAAAAQAQWLERGLQVSSRSYARSDGQWVR
jgi:hypothetical protein